MSDLLKIDAIDVSYGDVQVINSLSLTVPQGEIVALFGGNGAGKTTTLRAVSGLVKPRSGGIQFCGNEISRMPAHTLPELGLTHVPEGRHVFPHMTVRENLELGAYTPRVRGRMRQNMEAVFDLFPVLKSRSNSPAGVLSGGQQQMVAIGRGLMAEPKLLLLDEPSLGLAPAIVDTMFETIKRIRDLGVTVLLVEQNLWESVAIADRYYLMATGRMVSCGLPQDLAADEAFQKAYLGI